MNHWNVDLGAYRARVRAALINTLPAEVMPTRTLNELLHHLALERVEVWWTCTGEWHDVSLPEARVQAVDEDAARQKYIDALKESDLEVATRLVGGLINTDDVEFAYTRVDVMSDREPFYDADDIRISVEEE